MDIRLNMNPAMRTAYLKNQIEAAAAKKPESNNNSRSQDTVVISAEARTAYADEQAKKTQTVPKAKPGISDEEGESVRVNGLMMKNGKLDNSETTFFHLIDGLAVARDVVLGGDLSKTYAGEFEMIANQIVRDQISQSVQDLLAKNGIKIPEGQSFTMDVNPYDFYINVRGLDDPELTEAIEKAVNVGNNGYVLDCHISDCARLNSQFGLTVPSAEESMGKAKESLYFMVQDLAGCDIRTLRREDGHIYMPDGQDLWDALEKGASQYPTPDGIISIDISPYWAIYQRIAQLGWDSVPDPVYQLLYQDGGLYDIGTDYGYGPGQTGWQSWVHEHAAELAEKIINDAERLMVETAARTSANAVPRTASVPEKTAAVKKTAKEPDTSKEPEESEQPEAENPDEATWKGPRTIPMYGKREPLVLELEKLRLADGILLTQKVRF
ncbi:MAG: DUF4885 domain-containing protein [Oscillospiraceae bacterium]|nr:DUF4885 domain-containing protein [Oscillospiraceae bacterium]